jgi:hypothetical protein
MRQHSHSLVILISALLVLSSCLIIPTVWEKQRFSEEVPTYFTLGISTVDDVVETLGQPDIIWETEHIYVYTWKHLQAEMPFFIPGPGKLAAGAVPFTSDEALLILFDDAGCMRRIGRATKSPFESYGEFLRDWLKQSGEPRTEPQSDESVGADFKPLPDD